MKYINKLDIDATVCSFSDSIEGLLAAITDKPHVDLLKEFDLYVICMGRKEMINGQDGFSVQKKLMKVTKMVKRETGKDCVVSQVIPTSNSKINSHINLINYCLPESFLEATQVINIDMNDVNYLTILDTGGTTISDIGGGLLGEVISKQLVARDINQFTDIYQQ